MKYLFSTLFLVAIFFSCNKSTTSLTPPVVQDSLLKSYSVYLPNNFSRTDEVFHYDSAKQLAGIYTYRYDTSSGSPEQDSIFMIFSLRNQLPASYDMISLGTPVATTQDLLFFDGENRMVLDSMVTSTGPYIYNLQSRYDDFNNTIIEWYFKKGSGNYTFYQVDTMNIQNENIRLENIYVQSSFYWTRSFTPGNQLSPLYNELLSKSLGSMIYVNGFGDYRSKNLPALMTDSIVGYENHGYYKYVWTTDASGRVVSGTSSDASGHTEEIIKFNYNH